MEVYIWAGMFYVVLVLAAVSTIRMIVNRSTGEVRTQLRQLQAQVKRLEDELKNKSG
ncbi:hypothetical protein ACI7RC_21640 [Brevibacillus sp. B_LB10_24]|uniref:hypothetical protein n=1 Tax=Brevibacillus sp. B_LB10_24 TaxID=3380645 RepID=UPI0038BCA8EA